jgi:hypothetical protein
VVDVERGGVGEVPPGSEAPRVPFVAHVVARNATGFRGNRAGAAARGSGKQGTTGRETQGRE